MDIVRVFGTNVKCYRQALGISQEAFAEKCGLQEHISVQSSAIAGVFRLKIFSA